MIPKNIIKLSMILSIMLGGIFTSCTDDVVDAPLPNPGSDATVTFALNVPGASVPDTRGLSELDETNVETIDVLLFRENGSARAYYGKVLGISLDNSPGNTKSFTAVIPINDYSNYDITVIANGREQILSAGLVEGESKSDALNKLVKTIPAGEKWNNNCIPMWGEALNVTVNAGTNLTGENAVKMTRMISRIDVKLSDFAANGTNEAVSDDEKNANFELVSVRLYNYSTKGTLVPDLENGWNTGNATTPPEATLPNPPASGYGKALYGDGNAPLTYLTTDQHTTASNLPDSLIRAIYTLEAPAGSAETLTANTCLVIGGKYQKDTKETYYRIDFVTRNQELQQYDYISLLRNFRYIVTITEISGEGLGSPEQAFNSRPVNIEAEILEWNESYLSDVVFDGQNYLSVTPGLFEFHRDARNTEDNFGDNILFIKTDYGIGTTSNSGWYIEKIVDADDRNAEVNWLTLSPQSGTPKQKHEPADKVKLLFGENKEPEMRSAIVIIAAGRLRYEVEVKQSTVPDIMLNIVDPFTNEPVKELIFYAPIGEELERQEFKVDWRPQNGNLRIISTPVTTNAFQSDGAPESSTIIGGNGGTGTISYSMKPQGFTAEQVSENGGDPFLERSSKVDFTVSNGASYESKSIFLRHIHYNLLVDYDQSYLIDGSTHSIKVRSNAAWRIKSITENPYGNSEMPAGDKRILALKDSDNLREGTIGGYNITGESVTFTVPDDRSLWGSIEVTFESPDFPKKFEDKTVTLIFALPRVKLMGMGYNDSYCMNPALTSGGNTDRSANRMLSSSMCFGLNLESVVYSRGLELIGINETTGVTESKLKSYLDQKPDIFFISYDIYIPSSQTHLYLDYLQKGGVIVALYEREGNTYGAHHLLKAVFGEQGADIETAVNINGPGAVYKFETVNDMVINGPFGNLSGLYWGDDRSSTVGVKGIPESEAFIYSNGYDWGYDSPQHTDKVTALRHKKHNFIWFGDGGLLACNNTTSDTSSPFVFDSASQKPVPKDPYGRTNNLRKPVHNSHLFGNMITWAITQSTINDN